MGCSFWSCLFLEYNLRIFEALRVYVSFFSVFYLTGNEGDPSRG